MVLLAYALLITERPVYLKCIIYSSFAIKNAFCLQHLKSLF